MERVHATCVALAVGEDWCGVLLRGPSGSGKSDLALRLIDAGARLVSDDQTELTASSGEVVARAPESLAGRLEVRGVGILAFEYLAEAPVGLVCDLCAPSDVPRLPEAQTVWIAGSELPRLWLAPFESSAVAKVRLGLDTARRGILGH
ncbi:MAG: HPr kinase/phosphatase C-terminal domain-containing protein [Alphaproteobacteria bacterium]|nr:HPr kinase/phosphatase C-terminal domain-containing protein [Alphaproteobacteria bacterium]